ncbi:MAG: aminotransferase class I/II-fold pyridoxal phosphate-dependent enzyme [Hyphomicrobiales bacterium]
MERAAAGALERFGTGALASRIVGGERSIHREFERALAGFCGSEDALTLVSGFLTNASLISHIMGPNDCIVIDELSHASIVNGTKCGRATTYKFRHNDLDHLDHVLAAQRGGHGHCLIVVEGLYSMDGDVPDLTRLLEIKDRHKAWLLIDEAHSHGVLGAGGRGIAEHFGEDPARIDLVVGTLSKTFVSCGGFIGAAKSVIDLLRFSLPGFVFSVGMPPMVTASAMKALELVSRESWRVGKLAENTAYFMELAHAAGLDTGPAIGRAVVPIFFARAAETMIASERLLEEGFYAPPIVQIGVPKDMPRIRFFFSAAHEKADIARAVDILAGVATELGAVRPRTTEPAD